MQIAARLVLSHDAPVLREAEIDQLVSNLDPEQEVVVLTRVASQLGDIIDGLSAEPDVRERVDLAMRGVLVELELSKGVPGQNDARG